MLTEVYTTRAKLVVESDATTTFPNAFPSTPRKLQARMHRLLSF
jgi:hypothetical protein